MRGKSEVRWGILGCGDVTEVKSGPALQKAARSRVVACMRRDGAKAEDYAARHGIARAFAETDALINDKDVDAVYIATPPDSHAALSIQAMNAGKSVLVEKPMALNVGECDAMIAAAEKNGVSLSVAYYRRALPRFEKLRNLIQRGALGEPRCVSVRHMRCEDDLPAQIWKLDPSVGGGGLFVDMQTHVLDWLDYVFGPAISVSGIVRRQSQACQADDLVSYSIGFETVVANALCAYSVGKTDEGITIYGSKGSATMPVFRSSPLIAEQGGVRTVHDLPDPPHVHQPFIERVIGRLLDGAPNPCSPIAARRTTAVVEKIHGSLP